MKYQEICTAMMNINAWINELFQFQKYVRSVLSTVLLIKYKSSLLSPCYKIVLYNFLILKCNSTLLKDFINFFLQKLLQELFMLHKPNCAWNLLNKEAN